MRTVPIHTQCATIDRLLELHPADLDSWLHPEELKEYARYRDPRRQDQWRAGRWLAKSLIQRCGDHSLSDLRLLYVRSRNAAGKGVRPEVLLRGVSKPWSLSIAHTEVATLVALTFSDEVSLGVDLTERRPLSDSLSQAWFTESEQAWLRGTDPLETATVWAIKEAIYKAIQRGEGFAPRQIEIHRLEDLRYIGAYHGETLEHVCRLHTWEEDAHVAALAIGCESARIEGRLVWQTESPEWDAAGPHKRYDCQTYTL